MCLLNHILLNMEYVSYYYHDLSMKFSQSESPDAFWATLRAQFKKLSYWQKIAGIKVVSSTQNAFSRIKRG